MRTAHAARVVGLLATGLTAAACADIMAPARAAAYPFAFGGDVFRWPADRLPVHYFADTRGTMAALLRGGVARWEEQFLYGEFRARLVTDSLAADVIVVWADSVPVPAEPDTAGALGACTGVTFFPEVNGQGALDGPIRVELRVSAGFTIAQVAACLPRVATHEIGHTLGLLQHSTDPGDVMYGSPGRDIPTARDRQTAEILYHSAPTIGPPAR